MDRFIGLMSMARPAKKGCLKSNMDRFIGKQRKQCC